MKDFFDKIMSWAKSNLWLAIGILVVGVFIFFPKLLRGLFRSRPHADQWYSKAARDRRKERRIIKTRSFRSIPRSVGRFRTRSGKPLPRSVGRSRGNTNRIIKSGPNAGKKAWQIKGSIEAKRHMANIRRKRR